MDSPDMLSQITTKEPHRIEIQSRFDMSSLAAAINRAVYLLRMEGNGPYDKQQAEILETILMKEKM